jgi:hypothetical protein
MPGGTSAFGASSRPASRSVVFELSGDPLPNTSGISSNGPIPGNVEAGEDIRILDVTNLDLDLPTQDFWLFDDATVVDLNFAPDGSLVNRDQREDPHLTRYRRWRDLALAHAVPLSEWNART